MARGVSPLKTGIDPTMVRLSASSMCQLSCPGCEPHRRLNKKGLLGWGFLRAADFRRFIDKNPQIRTVELSHSGEIFLNPELGDIIRYAFRKHVSLMAGTGVNLNNVSEAVCADLVKYRFRFLKVAIDGADQKTYVKYRRGGDLKKVIANIKRINAYKKKYKSEFPLLQWQFILFDHNVHQVAAARKMALALGMDFKIKYNACADLSPIKDGDLARHATGLQIVSREEYQKRLGKVFALSCHEFWIAPQINWDGKLLGCCANLFVDFGNVFDHGLRRLMRSKRYMATQKVVLGSGPATKDIPCSSCSIFTQEATRAEISRTTLGYLKERMGKHG